MYKLDAAKLARGLGRGWKPNVWENLGWHWEAVNAAGVGLRVRQFSRRNFWCTTESGAQYHAVATTARSAVDKVLTEMHDHVRRIEDTLSALRAAKV